MRVLVACEYSGRVRQAFRELGHSAWSCDLIESEDESQHHIQEDVLSLIEKCNHWKWDLIIAHPPCTDLAVSGARHFAEKIEDGRQQRALEFVKALMDAPCDRIAIENPISVISSKIRKPDQIVQPWMFGHPERKATCLWLKGLLKLKETNNVYQHMMSLSKAEQNRVHYMAPSPTRWKERSRTYVGLAEAMAEQWGGDIRAIAAE